MSGPAPLDPDWEVDAPAAARQLGAGTGTLLDIRTPGERAHVAIPGTPWIPMQEVPERLPELAALPQPLVLYCHHGVRSLRTAAFLRAHGVQALSLHGGIDAWSQRVDPALRRY